MRDKYPAIPAKIQAVFDAVNWAEVYVDDAGVITAERVQAQGVYQELSHRERMLLFAAARVKSRSGSLVRVLREYMLWRAMSSQTEQRS